MTFYDHIQENVRYSQTISYNLIHSQTMQDIVRSVRVIAPVLYHIVQGFCTSQCGQTIWDDCRSSCQIAQMSGRWYSSFSRSVCWSHFGQTASTLRAFWVGSYAYCTKHCLRTWPDEFRTVWELATPWPAKLCWLAWNSQSGGPEPKHSCIQSGQVNIQVDLGISGHIWAKECKKWIKNGASGCVGFDMNRIDSIPLEDTQSPW